MSVEIPMLILAAFMVAAVAFVVGWLLAQVLGRRELEQARIRLADVEARREQEQLAMREQLALMEQSRTVLGREFEVLANRIFESKQASFESRQASLQQHMQQQSKQSLEGLVTPLREQLQQFRQKVEQVYDTENRERASLITEIRLLKNLSLQVSEDASNLASALKGDNKAQGNWGEVILERILEQSGLQKGREYDTQVNLRSDEGERRLPDVIVRLPEGRDVVIDAKVSLLDYQRYCDAEDPQDRERNIKVSSVIEDASESAEVICSSISPTFSTAGT